jgi:hypothetical protein
LCQIAVERNAILKEFGEYGGWPVAALFGELSRCQFAGGTAGCFAANAIALDDE